MILAPGAQHAAGAQYAGARSNMSYAINYTAAYLSTVNKSAYLIFYPDMGQPYSYFDQAVNLSKSNQSAAYSLLAKARASALQQEDKIYAYRDGSFWIMLVMFVASSILLYLLMAGRRGTPRGSARKRFR